MTLFAIAWLLGVGLGSLAALPTWQWLTLAAVIGVEADNRRGLPSPEVLVALAGTTALRTDRSGWIAFRTDGERLWAEVERPGTGR